MQMARLVETVQEEEEGVQEVELEEPAVEAGHPGWSGGPREQTHSRGGREGRVTGNGDQFCQNWVHTPGAAELGWPAERETEGGRESQRRKACEGEVALLLFLSSVFSAKEDLCECCVEGEEGVSERLRAHGSTEQALLNS